MHVESLCTILQKKNLKDSIQAQIEEVLNLQVPNDSMIIPFHLIVSLLLFLKGTM